MSTLRHCPGGDVLVGLLYDDFEPGADPSRSDLEAHVRTCATCAAELDALGGVRTQLAAWTAPEVALGFAVVRTGATTPLTWRQRFNEWSARGARALPAAAAAVIVLGGAAALARLDVRYDDRGFSVRTGWGHAAPADPASGDAAVRQELAALRSELARIGAARGATVTATSAPLGGDDGTAPASAVPVSATGSTGPMTLAQGNALLRSFRQALDDSELRQQQNLQLRISEVTRDFDLQRRHDLVQVEQGFSRLNTERQQMSQQMQDVIRRVALGVPQQ
jgi:hypothetical protein